MGLFKSKPTRAADAALAQARALGAQAVEQGQAAVDQGVPRLKQLIADLEALVPTKSAQALPAHVRDSTNKFLSRVASRREDVSKELSQALGTADEYAHAKPWQLIGAAAGVALLVGFLAGRS